MIEIILLFLLLSVLVYGRMLYGRFTFPPGPTPLPIFGNVLAIDPGRPQNTIQEWSKIYGGVFTIWMAKTPIIVVTDYKLMKDALIKNGDQLSNRPVNFSFLLTSKGNYGILTSNGDLWKEQRRFSLRVIGHLGRGRNAMDEKILAEATKLTEFLQSACKNNGGAVMDLEMPIELCVGNILAMVLFGRAFNSKERFARLKKTIDKAFTTFSSLPVTLLNGYPWLRHIPLFGHFGVDDLVQEWNEYLEFVSEEVEACKRQLGENTKEGEPSDFTTMYLKEMKRRKDGGEDMSHFGEWQLMNILLDLFAGGKDTLTSTLRWALMAMAKYPEVQQKVFAEINSVIGRERSPTMADRQSLPYVMATLNEAQRWGNVIPVNFTHVNPTDFNLGGYKIPKWVEVMPQISALAVDERIFPSPEKFRPERFLDADLKTLAKVEEFAPFSLGKRQCLGEGVARTALFLVFVRLMQQFEFCVSDGADAPTEEPETRIIAHPQPHQTLVKLR